MTRGGILPFNDSITADHHALYIDFNATLLFGASQSEVASSSKNRTFKASKPEDSRKYHAAVKTYWKTHKMQDRIARLETLQTSVSEIKLEWERVDRDIGRAMQLGEKAVRKPTGNHAWSYKLRGAAYEVQYWRQRKKMHPYSLEESDALEMMRKTAGIKRTDCGIGKSIAWLNTQFKLSKYRLRTIQRDPVSFRRTELEEKLKNLEGGRTTYKDRKEAGRLRELINSENLKNGFKRL